jgi:hypothetical protein
MIKETLFIYGHLFWRTFILMFAYLLLQNAGLEIPALLVTILCGMIGLYWALKSKIIEYVPPETRKKLKRSKYLLDPICREKTERE